MDKTFSTVDEYIDNFPASTQDILQNLREFILKTAPEGTQETISYAMPTYKWNGNLIHFAQAKNHIGIYPGPHAISVLKAELAKFKTTKGAIQIPLDIPFPYPIIESLLSLNVEMLAEKTGPKWDSYRANWTECEDFMQQLIQKTNLTKEFKWGNNVYTHNGKNVIAWAGFKNFFSIWFYNGVFLQDTYKVLISANEGKTKALRQWRFTEVKDMNEKKILEYIQESIQTIDDGKELKLEKDTKNLEITGYLKDVLKTNSDLRTAFDALTPGKRKEYVQYIDEAKQEKTKKTRLDKIIPLIIEGKGLHDKYKR